MDEEIANYQMEVVSIYHNLKEIQRTLQAAKKSSFIQMIVKEVGNDDEDDDSQ